MKKVLKQVVGIDVAQDELVCTYAKLYDDFTIGFITRQAFENKVSGFAKLTKWVESLVNIEVQLRFVMEATGVYHQSFAYYLHGRSYNVSVVLPNKISNFKRTLDKERSQKLTQNRCGFLIKMSIYSLFPTSRNEA